MSPSTVVARIGKPHGLLGEVTVQLHTDEPERRLAVGTALDTEAALAAAGKTGDDGTGATTPKKRAAKKAEPAVEAPAAEAPAAEAPAEETPAVEAEAPAAEATDGEKA